jgi:hypothetical protein
MKGGHQKNLAAIIRDIGAATHRRIDELATKEDRDIAWACVTSAIVGAALNKGDPVKVIDILQSTLIALTPAMMVKQLTEHPTRDRKKSTTKRRKADVSTRLRAKPRRSKGVD